MVQGRAHGVGAALAGLCDIAIVTEDSSFAIPEMDRDIPPTLVTAALCDRIPLKTLAYLVLTRRVLSGTGGARCRTDQPGGPCASHRRGGPSRRYEHCQMRRGRAACVQTVPPTGSRQGNLRRERFRGPYGRERPVGTLLIEVWQVHHVVEVVRRIQKRSLVL
jgi:hypothetical protein